jgi:hypothetical protein
VAADENRREQKRISALKVQQQEDKHDEVKEEYQYPSRRGSGLESNADRGNGVGSKDVEEREYLENFALAAREQRAALKRIKELHGGPVAFEVNLDVAGAHQQVVDRPSSAARREAVQQGDGIDVEKLLAEKEAIVESHYDRGMRVVLGAMTSKDGGEEPVIEKQRRSWGAPVDVDEIRKSSASSYDGRPSPGEDALEGTEHGGT